MHRSDEEIIVDDEGSATKGPPSLYYSTQMVITFFIFSLSWATTVMLWGCRIIDIPLPLFSPTVRYTHMSIVVLSTILVRLIGKSEFKKTIKHQQHLHVTGFQSFLIVVVMVSYAVLVLWVLGLLQ